MEKQESVQKYQGTQNTQIQWEIRELQRIKSISYGKKTNVFIASIHPSKFSTYNYSTNKYTYLPHSLS